MITSDAEKVGLSTYRLNRISELTHSYVDQGKVPGTITMVARRGQIVHFDVYGKMSLETGEPMREDAFFRIFSMTKPITCSVVMILYEKGLIDLGMPVAKILPEFEDVRVFESGTAENYKTTKPARPMTIEDLLKHTAGLSYGYFQLNVVDQLYTAGGIGPTINDCSLEEYVHRIASMPLVFSPGTAWNYSVAHDVLGRVIEVITGKTLDVAMKDEIFDPLGMEDTAFYVTPDKINRLTSIYAHRSGVPREIAEHAPDKEIFLYAGALDSMWSRPPRLLQGGGGLVSTAKDYYTFAMMLMRMGQHQGGSLLSRKSVELMTMDHLQEDIHTLAKHQIGSMTHPGQGYGYGVRVITDLAKAGILGSVGEYSWSGSAHTSFFNDPKEDLFAMLLTQVLPPGAYPINRQFRNAVYQSIVD